MCQRFTTSKLKLASDLNTISTYGFRGEALASLSYCSHLNIISRTRDQECAYSANYKNGHIIENDIKNSKYKAIQECIYDFGTSIIAKNLFYNNLQRKSCINPSEENSLITEIINYYSIIQSQISFAIKLDSPVIRL